ncbi:MAG: hypothetical protein LBS56_08400, partial [Propionibacteriaceae bacterium]|nr:hypothetical protein [Propionibacteriaceae bacterium]
MRVAIVGAGPGSGDLTHDGERAIAQAGLVIGSARLVAALAQPGQATVVAARPDDVVAAIESARPHDLVAAVESPHPEHLLAAIESARPEHLLAAIEAARPDGVVTAIESAGATDVAVLMSGDVGFHSGASKVAAWLRGSRVDAEVRLIPGVSSVAALAARVGVPWEDACLVSCHGGVTDLVSPVRRHRTTIALTGGNLPTLAAALREAGYGGLHVWAGEDLGLPGETVTRTTVDGLAGRAWSSLTTILVDNPDFDSRVLSGLPDDRFVRGRVPLTKSAVRAVALARLAVRPTDTCFDVGCGTGSVTVELALAA